MAEIRTLFDKKVRETAGAQTSARFQFQAHVALLKIFDLHEAGAEYRVILDHFDDVVVVTRSEAGDLLNFYQVKTKGTGLWTIAALTKGKEGASSPASIIGKMYQNAAIFGSATDGISFLSDAGFDVKDASGKPFPSDTLRIPASALAAEQMQAIDDSLDTDFPPPRMPECKGILFLERSPMTVAGQATFVTGRLVQMLSAVGEDETLPIKAVYETLFANASARSANAGFYADDASFFAAKALSRADIEGVLARAAASGRFRSWWPALAAGLGTAGLNPTSILRLQNECLRYLRARSAAQFRPTTLGQAIAAKIPQTLSDDDLGSSVLAYATTLASAAAAELGESSGSLLPVALVEIMERLHDSTS